MSYIAAKSAFLSSQIILSSPSQPQIVFSEPCFQIEEPSGLLFQSNHGILSLRQDFSCSWDDTLPSSRSLFPFNMVFSTSKQSLRCSFPQLLSCVTQGDAGCSGLLLPLAAARRRTESPKGLTSLSCVNNWKSQPASSVSVT